MLHIAPHRRVGRHGANRRILQSERDQIVVMQLRAPTGMLLVERRNGARQSCRDRRVCPGVSRHSPRERGHRVGLVSAIVVPALERRDAEAKRRLRGRVAIGRLRQLAQPHAELARLGRRRQKRADDRKAQTRPAHARGRAVLVWHVALPFGRNRPRPKSERPIRDCALRRQMPSSAGARLSSWHPHET